MENKSLVRLWIGYVIILIGVAILASPFISGFFGEKSQIKAVTTFAEEKAAFSGQMPTQPGALSAMDQDQQDKPNDQDVQDDQNKSEEQNNEAVSEKDPATLDTPETSEASEEVIPTNTQSNDLYRAALAYNEEILADGQSGLDSLKALETLPIDMRDYGFSEDVFGSIRIPRMNVELALYLGSSEANMAKGAAILGQTSLPLGLADENTSISGHRGWVGTDMFRNIQLLQMDDPIYVTTPWKQLVYRVSEIRIVPNTDSSWCQIREGETMITLMTCHPYTQNYQRYIVFATLTDEQIPAEEEILVQNEETLDPSPKPILQVNEDGTRETVMVDAEAIEPNGSEYGAVWSNVIILAEDSMRNVMLVLAGLAALVGIWLIMHTIRVVKENKRKQVIHAE